MPVKVFVNILEIVTAGLAKLVEDVNQYPAAIYNDTAIAILFLSLDPITIIVSISPNVATISERKVEKLYRSLVDHSKISFSK